MKRCEKIHDRVFKEEAVQLSYERHNISELAKELDVTAHKCINRDEYEEFG
jgi:transposase